MFLILLISFFTTIVETIYEELWEENWYVFLILVIAMFVDLYISKKFAKIAEDKGYSYDSTRSFILCFGFIGYLLVIAMPDKNARGNKYTVDTTKTNEPTDYLSDLPKI